MVNHVVLNGKTAIDLRSDTVTAETLVTGATAHNAKGEMIVGTYVPKSMTVDGTTLKLSPAKTNGTTLEV